MEVNLGSKAATRQRWDRKIAIQPIIKELRDEHPRANVDKLVKLLVERLREDDDALVALAEYAVRNALNSLEGYVRRERAGVMPHQRIERAADIAAAAKEAVDRILLLNLEMPNGKRMRYCTGEEMGKFGAGYSRIAKKVGKTKCVGQVLDENGVRELMA